MSLGGPAGLLASGVPASVPQGSKGNDMACRWEAAFCRRLKEGIICHLWDGAGMSQLLCLECFAFCFASLPTEVLKKLH